MLSEVTTRPWGKAFLRAVAGTVSPTYNTTREPVAEPPKLTAIRARKRAGRCHELAMRTLLHSPDDTPWKLVQGYVQGGDPSNRILMHHSWLECGETVYDAVHDAYFTIEEHRRRHCAIGVHEFTRLEMCQQLEYYEVLRYCGPQVIQWAYGRPVGPPTVPAKRKQAA